MRGEKWIELRQNAGKYGRFEEVFWEQERENWPSWDDLKTEFRPRLPSPGRFGEGENRGSKNIHAGTGFGYHDSQAGAGRRHLSETNPAGLTPGSILLRQEHYGGQGGQPVYMYQRSVKSG